MSRHDFELLTGDYEKVRFLVKLLGAPPSIATQEESRPVDLWISGE